MSRSKKKKKKSSIDSKNIDKRKNEILGILITALSILSALSLYSPTSFIAGDVGEHLAVVYQYLFGKGAYLIPVMLFVWGITLIRLKGLKFNSRLFGFLMFFIISTAVIHTYIFPEFPLEYAMLGRGGGYIGGIFSWLFIKLFGYIGSYVLFSAFLLIGILLWFDILLVSVFNRIKSLFAQIALFFKTDKKKKSDKKKSSKKKKRKKSDKNNAVEKTTVSEEDIIDNFQVENEAAAVKIDEDNTVDKNKKEKKLLKKNYKKDNDSNTNTNYFLPDAALLKDKSKKRKRPGNKSEILEKTLDSFGVKAKVLKVNHGPTITRYEVQPSTGVKVSKIVSLADDIALALAAPGVRIEAPIPGKAAVGIEVPHQENITVCLRDIISRKEFLSAKANIPLGLGMGIDGKPIIADLFDMPHVLVAGATGSGKSVCMNVIIASLLFKFNPDDLKLILVDPKKVELSVYKGLPHLFAPVVTDAKKASNVLKLVVEEMESRYELFSSTGTRGIKSYNKKAPEEEKLPYIVVIIDELSDLMMVAASEVEDSICRLAQMARAAGIHLVIATQRPSVDVITGLIKANIPSRISFSVSSQTDSRTILDSGGAEKLLGNGDMLFAPSGQQKATRIQGAFIDNEEISGLVDYVKNQGNPDYEFNLDDIKNVKLEVSDQKDELYEEAVTLVVEYRASISMLQRRLHIGHSRAARLIDMMEANGIVGPYAGSKPREVLITPDELDQYLDNKESEYTLKEDEEGGEEDFELDLDNNENEILDNT